MKNVTSKIIFLLFQFKGGSGSGAGAGTGNAGPGGVSASGVNCYSLPNETTYSSFFKIIRSRSQMLRMADSVQAEELVMLDQIFSLDNFSQPETAVERALANEPPLNFVQLVSFNGRCKNV